MGHGLCCMMCVLIRWGGFVWQTVHWPCVPSTGFSASHLFGRLAAPFDFFWWDWGQLWCTPMLLHSRFPPLRFALVLFSHVRSVPLDLCERRVQPAPRR